MGGQKRTTQTDVSTFRLGLRSVLAKLIIANDTEEENETLVHNVQLVTHGGTWLARAAQVHLIIDSIMTANFFGAARPPPPRQES